MGYGGAAPEHERSCGHLQLVSSMIRPSPEIQLCEHGRVPSDRTPHRALSPKTLAVTAGRPSAPGSPLNQPLVLASNFRDGGDYARTHGTETWAALEQAIGALEGGRAVAFASGMAAASAIVYALAPPRPTPMVVVIPTVSYLGVRSLLAEYSAQGHVELRPVDITDIAAVAAAANGADLIWVETPTNPTLDVADLVAIAEIASDRAARFVVDSTFATPLLQRPLDNGAAIVLHSGTKFIGGHSDLLIGLCVTNDDDIHDRLFKARTFQGATPGALEAFLALRGLRTLPIRLAEMQRNATVLVERLRNHPGVVAVRYPGQGAMVAIIVRGGAARADAVCAGVRVIVPTTSLGGVETTIERRQKYAGDAHVDPGLLRLSVGIEDVEDLWADLDANLPRGSADA
jgi:cystathionine gamma-synthase